MLSKEQNNLILFILILILIITLFQTSSKIYDNNSKSNIKKYIKDTNEGFTNNYINVTYIDNSNKYKQPILIINVLKNIINDDLLKKYNILKVSDNENYTYIQLDEINIVKHPNIYQIIHYKNNTNITEIKSKLELIMKNKPIFKLMGNSKTNSIYTNNYNIYNVNDNIEKEKYNSNYKLTLINKNKNNKNDTDNLYNNLENDNLINIYSSDLNKNNHLYLIENIDNANIYLNYFDDNSSNNNDELDKYIEINKNNNIDNNKNILIVRKELNNIIKNKISNEMPGYIDYLNNQFNINNLKKIINNTKHTNL